MCPKQKIGEAKSVSDLTVKVAVSIKPTNKNHRRSRTRAVCPALIQIIKTAGPISDLIGKTTWANRKGYS
ncbi:MAG: hypothetical protein ACI8TF_003202 [Paracoccaceae bacterium]|jgi:hypothetical protein